MAKTSKGKKSEMKEMKGLPPMMKQAEKKEGKEGLPPMKKEMAKLRTKKG
jgi:hypothetical protein